MTSEEICPLIKVFVEHAEVWAAVSSKAWHNSCRACFSLAPSRRQKESLLTGWSHPSPKIISVFSLGHTSLTTVWVNQNYYIRLLRPGLHADFSHEESLSRSKWNRLAKLSGFHTNRTRSSSANVKLWLYVSPGPKPRKGGGAIMAFRGRVPPKRGTFLRLQVSKKVGITRVEVYTMVGKSVLLVCRVVLLNSWNR